MSRLKHLPPFPSLYDRLAGIYFFVLGLSSMSYVALQLPVDETGVAVPQLLSHHPSGAQGCVN